MIASEKLDIFSPQNFQEYVGQNQAKKIAQIIVSAAQIEKRPLPNILIDGSYGLGKTSLAKIIHLESGDRLPKVIDALAVNKDEYFSSSQSVIIDEIHNLDPQVADSLSIRMDQGHIHITGCTTNPGVLPAPFRSRFRQIHLERYTINEVRQIIDLALIRRGLITPTPVLMEIAKRSRLNPRVAINYVSFILDYMTTQGAVVMASRLVQEAFSVLGVDQKGFLARDFAYMKALPSDRPVGIHYLSSVLGIDQKTVETEIEPYLLQNGYIDRMPRGRIKLKDI